MGVWTTSASWEWPKSSWRTWTCLPQSAAGISCSLPPPWQTPASDPSPDASLSPPWRAPPALHAPRHPEYIHTNTRAQGRVTHTQAHVLYIHDDYVSAKPSRHTYTKRCIRAGRHTWHTHKYLIPATLTHMHSQHAAIVFTGISSRLSVHTLTHRSVFTGKTISRSKTGEGVIYLNM